MKRNLLFSILLSIILVVAGCSQNSAQVESDGEVTYPTKPVKVIVPYGAGGGTDLTSRVLMKEVGNILGESFNVENVPGASGTIGAAVAASAVPDGYTVFFTPSDPIVAQPNIVDVPYNLDDFKAVAGFSAETSALAVRADSPWETLEDLLEEENSNNVIDRGHSGVGGISHICLESFFGQTDIQVRDVPFDGGALAIAALLGGHIDVVGGTAGAMMPYIESDEIRILAIAADERSEMYPDVPTFKEKGFDISVCVDWFMLVPKDTPDEIVEVLEKNTMEAANSDPFKEFVKERKQQLIIRNGEEIMEKVKSDFEIFNKMLN